MQNHKTIVLSNQEIAPHYYRMRILAPEYTKQAQPGQFVMLRVQESHQPLLRRPFGIFRAGFMPADCDSMPPKEFIELIYKVVGRGTEFMQGLHQGDSVELLGPLGKGFELGDPQEEKFWLAAVSVLFLFICWLRRWWTNQRSGCSWGTYT